VTKKRLGPRRGSGGGPGGIEDSGEASSLQDIAQKSQRGPDRSRRPRAKVWWLTKGQLRQCEIARRWSNAKVLFGEGNFAVVSHCHDIGPDRVILVSLHRTRARAEAIKAELDRNGCSQDWMRCQGEHEVADLSDGFESLCEHLVKVREAWRPVRRRRAAS
jgi:hypothetical protein